MASGLHFTSAPSGQEISQSYPILRCDAEQKYKLAGFVLSSRIYGVEVHYVGRSVPCMKHTGDCAWCNLKRATRWVGYAPCVCHNRQRLFIMELTPGVMPSILTYHEQFGSLRGCMVHLSRRNPRPNARLDINILAAGAVLAPGDLPPAFDIEAALAKIFGLDSEGKDPTQPKTGTDPDAGAAQIADRITAASMARAAASDATAGDEDFLEPDYFDAGE